MLAPPFKFFNHGCFALVGMLQSFISGYQIIDTLDYSYGRFIVVVLKADFMIIGKFGVTCQDIERYGA